MHLSRSATLTLALSVAALGFACSASEERPERPVPYGGPPPTEHWLEDGAEKVQKKRRKEWFEERHKTPPEVDWRAIERANGRASTQRRNLFAGTALAATGRWIERGSDNNAGRMHVTVPRSDGGAIYAGSSKGGVWKGGLGGENWTPIGDNLFGGAHWLGVVPGLGAGAPDVVLAATDGGLIHVSSDDGATWVEPAGLPSNVNSVRRVLVPKDGSNAIFALVRSNSTNQLYRSLDRGQSFQMVHNLGGFEGDVWAPRDGAGTLYLIDGDTRMSADGGSTWQVVAPLPSGSSEGELTGSEAGAPRLWAALRRNGGTEIHRSDNAGASWSFITTISDYWGTLSASITDADLMAYGGVEVHVTRNAGASFDIVNPWWEYYGQEATKLHADIPGMDVVPDIAHGEIWYVSTDGGLFRSIDALNTVENLSLDGLRVSQYYTTYTMPGSPETVAAGAQDQGYQWTIDPPGGSGTTKSFEQLISGDYGHLTSVPGANTFLYSTYPGFVLIARGATTPTLFQEDFPVGENYAWMPPVVADPYANTDFFFCATRLYKYEKGAGNSWSPSLWSAHDFGSGYISALVFSPVDPERAYAATNNGRLYVSDDHGLTWTQSTGTAPGAQYFYGSALIASSTDVDTAWVGGSGYGPPAVMRTTDGGLTWHEWNDGMPSTLVYSLAEAPDGSGDLFAGTETGVLRRRAGSQLWSDVTGNEAPVTTYWSAESVADLNAVRFGTYGRGIWDFDVSPTCRYEIYGAGATPFQILSLDSPSDTTVGTNHTLELTGGFPFDSGWLVLAFGDAWSNLWLANKLLVDEGTAIPLSIAVDGSGSLSLDYFVPGGPALVGFPLYWQAILQNPLSPLTFATSNGLAATFCL